VSELELSASATRPVVRRLAGLLVAGFFNVAPSVVPPWRLDPGPAPAVTLVVGAPVTALVPRSGGSGGR
jgi:hypothetical protein